MLFWPFKRRNPEPLSPAELRDRLIQAAASGFHKKMLTLCRVHKAEVIANLEVMCKAPDGIQSNPASLENYIQCLGAVAQCLANECGAPELWNKLCGTPDNNPILRWQRWFNELPQRMENLEHKQLIKEARAFIQEVQSLQGNAARQNEAFLNGRLGELLFHSGKAAEAIEPFCIALQICQEINDVEGQRIYLGNLLEMHRYRGEITDAIRIGEELATLMRSSGQDVGSIQKRIDRMAAGEPPCRGVCCWDGKELELDEISQIAAGKYDFVFSRNRLSMQMAQALVQQGNELASSGMHADALEKYQAAIEVDPYDPDPVYQSGTCLLELGAYGKAKEAFEEVERLAPAWFRCRSDCWLAEQLEAGKVTDDEFRLLRVLEDGTLPPSQAIPLAEKATKDYPEFAPFLLILGNLYQNRGEKDQALTCYRRGLELVAEPDLESRLLCAAAGLLPKESKERMDFVKRAVALKGSLVAQSTARLLGLT